MFTFCGSLFSFVNASVAHNAANKMLGLIWFFCCKMLGCMYENESFHTLSMCKVFSNTHSV